MKCFYTLDLILLGVSTVLPQQIILKSLNSIFKNANAVYNKIAFTRQESSNDWDIWIMDTDGNNQQKLLDSPEKDMNPHFSHDGGYIAFTRSSGTPPNFISDAYMMNSNGTNVTNLTSDVTDACAGPKFTWDGTKIAYFRNVPGTGNCLCVMNADGSNKHYVNDQNGNPVTGDAPFFTPDGQWVVFQRVYPGLLQGAVYKVPSAGGEAIQLTNASDFDELPRVSADGQYVVCKYNPSGSSFSDIALFSINQTPPTSSVTNLTNSSAESEDSPMYSYEGNKIAYMGTVSGSAMEIFMMHTDGTGETRLTNNSVQDFDPTFSPYEPVPVELISFTAEAIGNDVELKWQTATELNCNGFEIERTSTNSVSRWEKVGFIKGSGSSTDRHEYLFEDKLNLNTNLTYTLDYRLKQIDNDGSFCYSDVVEVKVDNTPGELALYQNYPNPFNPATTIKYSIPIAAGSGQASTSLSNHVPSVQLIVYDVLGNEVATLVDEEKSPGNYEVQFNASNLASGVYIYRLRTSSGFLITKKLILMK